MSGENYIRKTVRRAQAVVQNLPAWMIANERRFEKEYASKKKYVLQSKDVVTTTTTSTSGYLAN